MISAICNCLCTLWAYWFFINGHHGTAWNWVDFLFAAIWALNAVWACICVIRCELLDSK